MVSVLGAGTVFVTSPYRTCQVTADASSNSGEIIRFLDTQRLEGHIRIRDLLSGAAVLKNGRLVKERQLCLGSWRNAFDRGCFWDGVAFRACKRRKEVQRLFFLLPVLPASLREVSVPARAGILPSPSEPVPGSNWGLTSSANVGAGGGGAGSSEPLPKILSTSNSSSSPSKAKPSNTVSVSVMLCPFHFFCVRTQKDRNCQTAITVL